MAWLSSPSYTDPRSDEELAAAYRTLGNPELLGVLYARYLELMYGLCLSYFKDAGRAEDATMDLYEQLAVKLREHEVDHVRPWLYRLARNHCLMVLRRSASHLSPKSVSVATAGGVEVESMHIVDLAHLGLVEASEREVGLVQLEGCADELPSEQGDCIRRFYIEGASYKEVAEALDWSFDRVRSSIQNGRRNLRKCIERKRAEAS